MKKQEPFPLVPILALLVAFSIFFGAIGWIRAIPEPEKPEILIVDIQTVWNYQGKPKIIMDYMVGGIATNAVFYPNQMLELENTMDYLNRVGRVRYASPMITPLE